MSEELVRLDQLKADALGAADRGEIDIEKRLAQYPVHARSIWMTHYSLRFEANRNSAGAERIEG